MPWAIYQNWCIEKAFGLSKPTVLSFIWMRIAMVLQNFLLVTPVCLLIVKVMEWSGDWLVLVFFLCTFIVKLVIIYAYPILIAPLFSSIEKLPSWVDPIRFYLEDEAHRVGFEPENILY